MKVFLLLMLSLNLSAALATDITYWGKDVAVGNGHAKSFIKMYNDRPKEIGIVITEDGLVNLPEQDMQEYLLPMPTEVSVFPYKHITLDWNPHGHEPDGVYDKPHFDFHFYFITNEERQDITCMDDDVPQCLQTPAPEFLVSDYAPTPDGVPMMGWHWVDLLSPEFNGGIFTRTFVYGYYAGKPIFVEPMVTLEYLQSKETSSKDIRVPQSFPYVGGYFPRTYEVSYDPEMKVHTVVLENFVEQE